MINLIVIFTLITLFIFVFVKKIINDIIFFYKKNKKVCCEIKKEKKTFIIKKVKILYLKKNKKNIQSKSFYFKNLYNKQYYKISLKKKLLIDKLYRKLDANVVQFNLYPNFKILENAGLFNNKRILIFNYEKIKKDLDKYIFAIEEIKKYIDFEPILILEDQKNKQISNFKNIYIQDINLNLYQELNKLNYNYNSAYNEKIDLIEEDYYTNLKDVSCRRFITENIQINLNNCISYCFNSKKTGFIYIYIKLKSHFYNIERNKKYLKILFSDNKTLNYYTNSEIKNVFPINNKGIPFIKIVLKCNANTNTFFMTKNDFENYKNYLIKEKINISQLFDKKIYIKNDYFNNFFNNKLPKSILQEIYRYNFLKQEKIIFNKIKLSEILTSDYKIFAKIKSYQDLYSYLVENLFGIVFKKNIISFSPKISINYKLILYYKNSKKNFYIKKQEEKLTNFSGMQLLNVTTINLDILEKNALISY